MRQNKSENVSLRMLENNLNSSQDASPRQQILASNSISKQQRLEEERDMLQEIWKLRMKKLKSLQEALVLETGVTVKFQLNQQIQAEQLELTSLSDKIDFIESALM